MVGLDDSAIKLVQKRPAEGAWSVKQTKKCKQGPLSTPTKRSWSSPSCSGTSGVSSCDVEQDFSLPDVLENGNSLGVGEALQGHPVHRKDLVT